MEQQPPTSAGASPDRASGGQPRRAAHGSSGPSPAAGPAPPPGVAEVVRELRDSGIAGLGAARDAAAALRTLLSADVSLARSAAGRAAVFICAAVVFGASAWLMLMTALVVVLSIRAGLPWSASLAICGAASALGAWLALRTAMGYFEHTRMKATRRQLARLGIGELADFMPGAGSAECAREAEDRAKPRGDGVPGDSTPAGVTPP